MSNSKIQITGFRHEDIGFCLDGEDRVLVIIDQADGSLQLLGDAGIYQGLRVPTTHYQGFSGRARANAIEISLLWVNGQQQYIGTYAKDDNDVLDWVYEVNCFAKDKYAERGGTDE